jgi:hypothetical protein
MTPTNPFGREAARFLAITASFVDHTMSDDACLQAALAFAVGIEKLLKSRLYDINATYVFKKPEFENTIAIQYPGAIVPEAAKEFAAKKLDRDSISLRSAVQRAKAVSLVTLRHVNLIHSLADIRDLIVHGIPTEDDIARTRSLVQRYMYVLVRDFAEELGVKPTDLAGPALVRCADVCASHEEDLDKAIELRLESHRMVWEQKQLTAGDVKAIQDEMQAIRSKRRYGEFTQDYECPACGNVALLHADVDFDYSDGESYPVGAYLDRLECLFCGLAVDIPEELDALGITEWFNTPDYGDYY